MSHRSKVLKRRYTGIIQGAVIGVIKSDTRSLDYSSYDIEALAVGKSTASFGKVADRLATVRPLHVSYSLNFLKEVIYS